MSSRLTFWGKNDRQGHPIMYEEHKELYMQVQAKNPEKEWYMILVFPDDIPHHRNKTQNAAMHAQWGFIAKQLNRELEDVKREYLMECHPVDKMDIINDLLAHWKPTDLWPEYHEYENYLYNEAVIKPRGRKSSDLDDREAEEAIRFGIPSWALHEYNIVVPTRRQTEGMS